MSRICVYSQQCIHTGYASNSTHDAADESLNLLVDAAADLLPSTLLCKNFGFFQGSKLTSPENKQAGTETKHKKQAEPEKKQ